MMMKTYASVALLLLATNVANAETANSTPHAYSSWGAWASPSQPIQFTGSRAGEHKPIKDIPRGGKATYSGTLVGTGPTYVSPGAMVDVTGSSTLTANFGNRTISGVFIGDGLYRNCPVGPCGVNVPQKGYVNLSGTGSISGNGYTFPSLSGNLSNRVVPSTGGGGAVTASASGTFSAGAQSTTGVINAASTGYHPLAFSGTFSAAKR
jgi:hypothetical protein